MLRAKKDREVLAGIINSQSLTERIAGVLRREFGDWRGATKRIGRAIGCDPRAVRNWMEGINPPRAAELVRLMAECDALAEEILQMVQEARCKRGSG